MEVPSGEYKPGFRSVTEFTSDLVTRRYLHCIGQTKATEGTSPMKLIASTFATATLMLAMMAGPTIVYSVLTAEAAEAKPMPFATAGGLGTTRIRGR